MIVDLIKNDQYYYGFHISDLTFTQLKRAIEFQERVEPWLTENLGKFGEEWFVEIDKDNNSLRVKFKDNETETWFKLAWIYGAKEDYEANKNKNNTP